VTPTTLRTASTRSASGLSTCEFAQFIKSDGSCAGCQANCREGCFSESSCCNPVYCEECSLSLRDCSDCLSYLCQTCFGLEPSESKCDCWLLRLCEGEV
jgi:hypothetical protein